MTLNRKHYQWHELVIVLLAGLLALGILVFGSQKYLVNERGNLFDFYPRWKGSQATLAGESPYTDEVVRDIQIGMFGGELSAEDDQQAFAYPAYISIILAPIFLLPVTVATSIWTSLQLVFISASIVLWLKVIKLEVRLSFLILLLLSLLVVFRYSMIVYVLGQFVGFSMLGLTIAIKLAQDGKYGQAGVALAFSCIRPEYGVVAVVLIGYFALRGHWRVATMFIATLGILTGITSLLVGFWLIDFLSALINYSNYSVLSYPPALTESPVIAVAILLLVICLGLYNVLRSDPDDLTMVVSIVVIGVLLFVPQTRSYTLTVLMLPLLTALKMHKSTLEKMMFFGVIVSPWGFMLLAEEGLTEVNLDILMIPVLTLLVLLGSQWLRVEEKWRRSGFN